MCDYCGVDRGSTLLTTVLCGNQVSERSVDLVVNLSKQGNEVARQLVPDNANMKRVIVHFVSKDVGKANELILSQPAYVVGDGVHVHLLRPP